MNEYQICKVEQKKPDPNKYIFFISTCKKKYHSLEKTIYAQF
jgi:hypothetical protein